MLHYAVFMSHDEVQGHIRYPSSAGVHSVSYTPRCDGQLASLRLLSANLFSLTIIYSGMSGELHTPG